MKTLSLAVAVVAVLASAPLAQAATRYDGGWREPAALGTMAHPMRAVHQASGMASGASWGHGLPYTGVTANIGGPAGGFDNNSPG